MDRKTVLSSCGSRTVSALTLAGFNYLGLANNHIMDFGSRALKETLVVLDTNQIAHSGAGLIEEDALKPAILQLGSLKVALLSFDRVGPIEYKATSTKPGSAWGNTEQILHSITEAKSKADLVIIAIHWGADYVPEVADWQRKLAHACIDAGAVAIVGHHPHMVLPVEVYKGKPILYSVGNFSFGSYNPKAKGAIFKLICNQTGGIEAIHIYPLNVNNTEVFYQMQLLQGGAAERTINGIQKMSNPFGTRISFEDNIGVITLNNNTK